MIFPLKSEKNRGCALLSVNFTKLKALPETLSYKEYTKLSLSTNYVLQVGQILNCFSNTKPAFSDNLAFSRYDLSVFTKLNLILLTLVNTELTNTLHLLQQRRGLV